jgi:hypothetical protein
MRILFQAPNMAFFECGGSRLMLAVPGIPDFGDPGPISLHAQFA